MNTSIQPALSIVVPIYNVEEYLHECLDSIFNQGLTNYEVILINDGSEDKSGLIAQEFAEKHQSVTRYIENSNQGLSAARNTGIRNARGQYVVFVDSDDFLARHGLAMLLQSALEFQPDIVIGNLCHYREDGSSKQNKAFISADRCSGEAWLRQSLQQRKYFPAAWGRLYCRDFLIRNQLFFIDKLINEDQIYVIQSALLAETVIASNIPFYIYRHRSGSITRKIDPEQLRKSAESDVVTTLTLFELCRNKMDSNLTRLIMNQCIKLLRTSCVPLYGSIAHDDPLIGTITKQLDPLKLYRYLRIYRASHFADWIMLRISFRQFLAWRSKKGYRPK
jgi:glycosyltransferase involved in cell wall biosynthesis